MASIRTRTAKAVYWLAGKLSRIKTERMTYKLVSCDPVEFEPAGKSKGSCKLSMDLLVWSQHLDWDHWDHWALQHADCEGERCPRCGGIICETETEALV